MRNLRAEEMHKNIIDLGDEDIYDIWINVVPDEATDEDFKFIDNDVETYAEVVGLYNRLIK